MPDEIDERVLRERPAPKEVARIAQELAAAAAPVIPYPEPEDWGSAQPSALAHVEYVEDLVRPGRVLLVAAVEGVGKSYAIGELAIRLATAGGAFAGTWQICRTGAVLVAEEQHRDDSIRYRDEIVQALGVESTGLLGRFFHLDLMTAAHGQPALLAPRWRDWVIGWCREHDVLVLCIDTATTGTGGQEAWGEKMVALYSDFRIMLGALPSLALVLSVHLSKPNGRGQRNISSILGDWAKWADVVLLLEDEGNERTKLSLRKRVRRPRTVIARRSSGLLVDPLDVSDRGGGAKVPRDRVITTVLERPNLTLDEFAKALAVSESTARRYIKDIDQIDTWRDGDDRYAPVRLFIRNGHEG